MKKLLIKDFRLAIHPTVFLFWLLSAMLIIPNYPYYVVMYYSSLSLFFVCLSGRENHDIEYSLMLPVRKRDLVRARICFAVIVQAVQLVIAVPFAALRQSMPLGGNQVGMDANIAFFGLALLLLGIFNLSFSRAITARPKRWAEPLPSAARCFSLQSPLLKPWRTYSPFSAAGWILPTRSFCPKKSLCW